MSLLAQLVWVQTGDLEVKGCGFCYQSSKLPIAPSAKHWLKTREGRIIWFHLLIHYTTLLACNILYKLWTSEKAAFFYWTCGTCEENMQNTMFWNAMNWSWENSFVVFRYFFLSVTVKQWQSDGLSPPMQISVNTVSGVCWITLQTDLNTQLLAYLGE